jgi:protein ImuA
MSYINVIIDNISLLLITTNIVIFILEKMYQRVIQNDMVAKLQKDIFSLQGFRAPAEGQRISFGLGAIENAFPNKVFPTGAIHELVSDTRGNAAATTGFAAGLLGNIMQKGGICLWISHKRTLFPPALKFFGIEPDRVIFIDVQNEKDMPWMVEEALKCQALSVVFGELKEINLTESRRLQLAVEQSRVTGFLHRFNPRNTHTIASAARWKISHLPSETENGMPGVGFSRWQVELLKVRNGEPGSWKLQWSAGGFEHVIRYKVTKSEPGLLNIA